jgi:hypothetical protein
MRFLHRRHHQQQQDTLPTEVRYMLTMRLDEWLG